LQPLDGCMIVKSSTNVDPYKHSSIIRDVFDETAFRWSQTWTEICSNYQIKPRWAVRLVYCCVDGKVPQSKDRAWKICPSGWSKPSKSYCLTYAYLCPWANDEELRKNILSIHSSPATSREACNVPSQALNTVSVFNPLHPSLQNKQNFNFWNRTSVKTCRAKWHVSM
jgi:hypothetical protein